MKRVFIIHGWGGKPEGEWFPWLKAELEKRGFEAHVPAMPESVENIEHWVSILRKAVGRPDEDIYFVGHSIGCQTILRYFESLPKTSKVGGAVFVAGWFHLTGLSAEEEEQSKVWFENPINLDIATQRTKNMIAIFSDNDPYVPLAENKEVYEKFCRKIIIEKGKAHMNVETGITRLQSALGAVLELAKV